MKDFKFKIEYKRSFFFRKENYMLRIFFFTLCMSVHIQAQDDTKKMALISDADTANEVDDLYAIVRAIKEPKFNLLGITSAQLHTSPLATANTAGESAN